MNVTLGEIKDNLLHKWWFNKQNKSVFEKILWVPVKMSEQLPFPFNKYFIKIIDQLGLLLFR
ncbi:MAG: hypothetical protein KGY50_00460, partial [Candidatus Thermoplasmatota archaeon]|nr:hypothetical protein [Candidatus Thermoplasmatota archaeon]